MAMDDTAKKQLEAAARAAGFKPVRLTDDETALLLEGIQQPWNPRDENPHSDCMGDALRLAVKLEIDLHFYEGHEVDALFDGRSRSCSEPWGQDGMASARRAIVRAAAAMGEAA